MKPELLDYLRCPRCAADLVPLRVSVVERRDGEVLAGRLTCPAGHAFPIDQGVPNFVEPAAGAVSDVYNSMWAAQARQVYLGREDEFRRKFQVFAHLPEPLEVYFKDKVVLDAGCGEGRFTWLASHLGARQVVAVDSSHEALTRANAGTGNPPNCSFVRADIMRLPFRPVFDYVMSLGVLHHTPSTAAAYRSVVRHLKPGGYITIFVYGRWSLPLIIWPLRCLTLNMDSSRVLRFCDNWGFGYDPARRPRLPFGGFLRGLGRLDVLGIGRVTFEGLTTPYLHEHSLDEVRRWFRDTGVELISCTPLVSASGRRCG
jgi:SAM-dependent methyltransferase